MLTVVHVYPCRSISFVVAAEAICEGFIEPLRMTDMVVD